MCRSRKALNLTAASLLVGGLATLLMALNPSPVMAIATVWVSSTSPTANQVNVIPGVNITVNFSSVSNPNIDAATVSSTTIKVSGSFSGPVAGVFAVNNSSVTFNPAADFMPGETVEVTLTAGVHNLLSQSLNPPYTFQFVVAPDGAWGTFTAGTGFGTGGGETVALGDVNGDGAVDIAVGKRPGQAVIYLNNGSGTAWTPVDFGPANTNTEAMAIGDMNGDGYPDIVAGNYGLPNVVYLNPGHGVGWTGVNFGTGNDFTVSLAIGDVDSDGDLDIAVGNDNQQNVIYKNNGDGTVWIGSDLGSGSYDTRAVAMGDVNKDGALDIVVGNMFGEQDVVYLNVNQGAAWNPVNFGTGSDDTMAIALGDMDGDGNLDIVAGDNGGQNVVYKNNGAGTIWTGVNFGTGSDTTLRLALGDMDGSGSLDIAVANWQEQCVVYTNDGSATVFTPVNFGNVSDTIIGLAVGDVNADGALDIVVANSLQQNVYYANGPGVPAGPEISVGGNGVEIVSGDITPGAGDFTDFGSAAVTGGSINRIFVIENTGDGVLTLSGNPKVSLGGANPGDFTVTVQPASPVAAFSGLNSFTVRFHPSVAALRTATISIANDDTNENPYTFAIQGTGTGGDGGGGPSVGGSFTPVNVWGAIWHWMARWGR